MDAVRPCCYLGVRPSSTPAAGVRTMKHPRLIRLLRIRVWLEQATPTETQASLLWAACVGVLGGMCAVAFRAAIHACQHLLTSGSGSLVEVAEQLPSWQRLLVPTAGGFLAGATLLFGMRLARGETSTDYMEAIALRDGVIRTRPSLAKSLSSLLTISSGGSIGREGSMVQLGAWVASFIGRRTGLTTPRLRLLVACGAAAGIASVYNAPIAGALFVAEIVLGSIAMESFGPLIVASVSATLTTRHLLDGRPIFTCPPFTLVSSWEILPYLLLGGVAGVAAPAFLRLLRAAERLFTRPRWPVYARLAAGGFVVGVVSLYCPQVWGNGDIVIGSILRSPWKWTALLTVLGCKLVSTAATLGSGATGGVFTPTLFVGAAIGCLFGQAAHALLPMLTAPPTAYALVGMACLLAGTTHAPLTAILMLFEMTLDYEIILPLMLGVVTAFYVARHLDPRSIYFEALQRKELPRKAPPPTALRVRDLMKPAPSFVTETAGFAEIARRLISDRRNYLYVVGTDGAFRGAIALHDVKEYLGTEGLANLVTAYDLMQHDFPFVAENASLGETLELFATLSGERLPVVNNPLERRLSGSLAKTDVLLTLAHGLPQPGAPVREL